MSLSVAALFAVTAVSQSYVLAFTTEVRYDDFIFQQAAGRPIFDCAGDRALSARLKAGLPQQDEWINRTEDQLRAAEKGVRDSAEALQGIALKAAADLATRQLTRMSDIHTYLLNEQGISNLRRGQFIQKIDRLKALSEQIDKASKVTVSATAGINLGNLMRENRAALEDWIKTINDSGLADEGASNIAAALAGPAGELVVQTFTVVRDAALAAGEGVLSASEAAAARANLGQMRGARDMVRSQIASIDDFLGKNCMPTTTEAPRDRIQVQPPADAAPAPAPQTSPLPKSGGSGKTIGLVVGGAAAVAGGLYAGKLASDLGEDLFATTTTSTSTSTPTTTTTTTTSNTPQTYAVTVTRSCQLGSANSNPLIPGFIEPCVNAVDIGGSCGPLNFTFTVTGNVLRDCGAWLANGSVSNGVATARYDGVCGSGGVNVSGTLANGSMTGTGTCRGNTYTINMTLRRTQ